MTNGGPFSQRFSAALLVLVLWSSVSMILPRLAQAAQRDLSTIESIYQMARAVPESTLPEFHQLLTHLGRSGVFFLDNRHDGLAELIEQNIAQRLRKPDVANLETLSRMSYFANDIGEFAWEMNAETYHHRYLPLAEKTSEVLKQISIYGHHSPAFALRTLREPWRLKALSRDGYTQSRDDVKLVQTWESNRNVMTFAYYRKLMRTAAEYRRFIESTIVGGDSIFRQNQNHFGSMLKVSFEEANSDRVLGLIPWLGFDFAMYVMRDARPHFAFEIAEETLRSAQFLTVDPERRMEFIKLIDKKREFVETDPYVEQRSHSELVFRKRMFESLRQVAIQNIGDIKAQAKTAEDGKIIRRAFALSRLKYHFPSHEKAPDRTYRRDYFAQTTVSTCRDIFFRTR